MVLILLHVLLNSQLTPSLYHFLPSVSDIEEETKGRKDEKMEHSAVGESSLEQHVCESPITQVS